MARLRRLSPGDRQIIAHIVGRLHVSTPDQEVMDYILSRFSKGVLQYCTPGCVQQGVEFAVQEHHRNQVLYRQVMTGQF